MAEKAAKGETTDRFLCIFLICVSVLHFKWLEIGRKLFFYLIDKTVLNDNNPRNDKVSFRRNDLELFPNKQKQSKIWI